MFILQKKFIWIFIIRNLKRFFFLFFQYEIRFICGAAKAGGNGISR